MMRFCELMKVHNKLFNRGGGGGGGADNSIILILVTKKNIALNNIL